MAFAESGHALNPSCSERLRSCNVMWTRSLIMSHFIAQPCIGVKDTACVTVCPVDCIHPTKDEADFATAEMLYIDPDTCIDCGLCVDECPVSAIFPQEDLPAEWAEYIEKNTAYYKK